MDTEQHSKTRILELCNGDVVGAQEAWRWIYGNKPEAAATATREMWDVRCIEETVVGGVCPGWLPHVVTRFTEEDAKKVADDWRTNPRRSCIEVQRVMHRVPAPADSKTA